MPYSITISHKEAENLIEKLSGTGIIKTRKDGSPMNIELVNCKRVVGKYYDKGVWHETTKAAIHHGGKGSHIVPIKGSNYD